MVVCEKYKFSPDLPERIPYPTGRFSRKALVGVPCVSFPLNPSRGGLWFTLWFIPLLGAEKDPFLEKGRRPKAGGNM